MLVVEDNDAVRDIAAAMIEEMGYEAIVASNGPEGLDIITARDDLALVLSDVIMAGGMNGPELAAKALKVRPGSESALHVRLCAGLRAPDAGPARHD